MKKDKQKNIKKTSFIWLCGVAFLAVGLLLFCQFYFGGSETSVYKEGAQVGEVDISGLNKTEASAKIKENVLKEKEEINITVKNGENIWNITGNDLSLSESFEEVLDTALVSAQAFSSEDFSSLTLPAQEIYCGVEEIACQIAGEIDQTPPLSITFAPDQDKMFSLDASSNKKVDIGSLKDQIYLAINGQAEPVIEIPFMEFAPQSSLEDFLNEITLRGRFETDISKSTAERKGNISLALAKFNGMIVEPLQEVSFNQTTGARSQENGYKNAKIIVGGKYVPGVGGGVCQASTTLYNALLLSDVEVLQAYHHTLPASYVPLSFDAMVSEGYADLVFKNTLDTPIFIKAYTTTQKAVVEIYGQPFEDGVEIKTRTELVKILPHSGDEIIEDTTGEYENKVLYKGEYYRLKFPQEGYETKGYLQYYQNGVLTHEKEIRHDRYLPQNGVIVEGCFDLEEGMSLPSNTVKYIAPQKLTDKSLENAKRKLGLI